MATRLLKFETPSKYKANRGNPKYHAAEAKIQ
jgi:hypothetical protein